MSNRNCMPTVPIECARARRRFHELLDSGGAPGADADAHLASCADCREYWPEIRAIRETLAGLPELRLPDADLERVWSRSVQLPRRPALRAWLRAAAGVAAVALLAIAGAVVWRTPRPADPAISSAELARGEGDLRIVLGLTGGAIRRSQEIAMHAVVEEGLYPALERLPLFGSQPGRRWGDHSKRVRDDRS